MSIESFRDWLDEALDDISAAEVLLNANKFSKACFYSHQAAEKALKALSIYRLRSYEHSHSVRYLLERLSAPKKLIDIGEYLDRYYIPSRYPNAWPSGAPYKHYKRGDAEIAIKYAWEVINYVQGEIGEIGGE